MIELNDTNKTFPTLSTISISSDYKFHINQVSGEGNLTYNYKPLYNLQTTVNGENKLGAFDTEKLDFDLFHPLQMEIQKSYDNSVNIIFTDNKNIPRLVNSRLCILSNNRYKIPNRISNLNNIYSDTDITKFNTQTALNKGYDNICTCDYNGFISGGNLSCGNYHFYIAYSDEDGNTTNVAVETGLISVFLGNDGDPFSVHGGIRDTNSYKGISLQLHNLNTAYNQLEVLYTRDTSDDMQNSVTKYYKITKKFQYSNSDIKLNITGYESVNEISLSEFNEVQKQFLTAQTITQTSNRLFIANLQQNINYNTDLRTVSIQILPYLVENRADQKIGLVNTDYTQNTVKDDSTKHIFNNEYYNSKNIYYNLGYVNNELYRLGIVYIYQNGEESSVYNIRGGIIQPIDKNKPSNFSEIQWKTTTGSSWDSDLDRIQSYDFTQDQLVENLLNTYENTAGVVYLNGNFTSNYQKLYSIGIYIPQAVSQYLKTQGIIGFKIVRQKRMPMRLCQMYTIPVDSGSNLPLIHQNNKYIIESFLDDKKTNGKIRLVQDYESRLREVDYSKQTDKQIGAICPDYIIKMPFFNQLFTGSKFKIEKAQQSNPDAQLTLADNSSRIYRVKTHTYNYVKQGEQDTYIVGLQDGQTSVVTNNVFFRAKAGNAEEAFRYRLVGDLQKQSDKGTLTSEQLQNSNELVRGIYSPYLGLCKIGNSELSTDTYYNIYYPDWTSTNMKEYVSIRIQDNSEYYPISDNIALPVSDYNQDFFRGDNYFCNFTWRVNRNFQDSSAPTNDIIVEPDTWNQHFKPQDNSPKDKYGGKTEFQLINRGDVNAVKLGSWITIRVESNYNLNLRSIDESNTTETALFGQGRSFYPVTQASADGGLKYADTQQLNDGYNVVFGKRSYSRYADIPYVQNVFSNRIYYSNAYPYNSINNGYRIFSNTNFRDYNFELGSITKIIEWYGDLMCVLEKGIVYIPVQEKSIAADGTDIHINYNKILPDKGIILSSTVGSKWIDSIIKTPYGIFGIDTVTKKIWNIIGYGSNSKVNIISDFKVETFLNSYITLEESDNTPLLGIRNVHTFYNQQSSEVLFTYYNWKNVYDIKDKIYSEQTGIKEITSEDTELVSNAFASQFQQWNLAYNLLSNSNGGVFTTFYSWIPAVTFNINNSMYSISEDLLLKQFTALKKVVLLKSFNYPAYYFINQLVETLDKSNFSNIWKHGELDNDEVLPTNWYGYQHPFEFEFVVRDDPSVQKIWNNLQIISNDAEPESFSFTISGDNYTFKNDLSNIFWRQEATKELWRNLGSLISFDKEYYNITPNINKGRKDRVGNPLPPDYYDYRDPLCVYKVSTYFPAYYRRAQYQQNMASIMLMFNSYFRDVSSDQDAGDVLLQYDQRYLSGSEVLYNRRHKNFDIATHIACTSRKEFGILKSNSEYLENKWNVQIPRITIVQKNEKQWPGVYFTPLMVYYAPNDVMNTEITRKDIPEIIKTKYIPLYHELCLCPGIDFEDYFDATKWPYQKQMPIRNKWIKIRIRYSGKQLAIISAIKTIYTESYA